MYQNYMDDLSQFVLVPTWTICHTFILDDLSQVINLSKNYFRRFVTSHICPRRLCGKKVSVIWGDILLGKLECIRIDDAQLTSLR